MHVCILGAGQGSRLGGAVPSKALVPYLGAPLVRHQLDVVRGWGATGATLLARDDQDLEALRAAVAGAALPCTVTAVPADSPGGTNRWPAVYDWLADAADRHCEPVLTINVDLLVDATWSTILTVHRRSRAELTLAATASGGGDGQHGKPRTLTVGPGGLLARHGTPVVAHQIGMSVTEPLALRRLRHVSQDAEDPWADEFVPRLVAFGSRVALAVHDGYWRDVGTWRRVWAAHGDHLGADGRHVDPTARVDPGARVMGWAWIGAGAVVEAGAVVADSVIGAGAVVERDARVASSLLGERAVAGAEREYRLLALHAGHAPMSMPEALGT